MIKTKTKNPRFLTLKLAIIIFWVCLVLFASSLLIQGVSFWVALTGSVAGAIIIILVLSIFRDEECVVYRK